MADFQVIFMDAGQGDCTLIVYPDHSVTLVDCGSTKSGSLAIDGIKEVIKRELSKVKTPLVRLVLTHPDIDHINLLKDLDIEQLCPDAFINSIYYGGNKDHYDVNKYAGELLDTYDENGMAFVPDVTADIDKALSSAGVNVVVLSANATGNLTSTAGSIVNGNSIVLLVEFYGVKVFLMGDAFVAQEQAIEALFTSQKKKDWLQRKEFTVLKMGHHGSQTSTSKQWVQLLTPNILAVSSGTKGFGPNVKGMPTLVHLNSTMALCKLEKMTAGFNHNYVVFDETSSKFILQGPTLDAIWTTAYGVNPEAGQTWSITVNPKTKVIDYGFTGY